MTQNGDKKKPLKLSEFNQNLADSKANDSTNLSTILEENIDYLKERLKDCSDIVFRNLALNDVNTYLIYADGMVNLNILSRDVINNLLKNKDIFSTSLSLDEKTKLALPVGQVALTKDMDEILKKVVGGNILILFEGIAEAIILTIPTWEKRGVSPAEIEPSIKGTKESFTETLNVNMSLVRRRLLHPDCKFVTLTLGKYSNTRVVMAYIDSIANDKIVKEVRSRLEKIEIDSIGESVYISELIQDAPLSPFPTVQSTERPDKVVAALLEGRVAILQENTPFALIAPSVLVNYFMSVDDYSLNYWTSTFTRYLRYIGIFLTTFLPALFVAFTTFSQDMIPTPLLITLANQREGVPFPAFVEALIMVIAFEILEEAGTRLPKPIGSTVSIVGALIVGDAAVKAGLVSPAMVIVTAMTAIAGFTLPSLELNNPILATRMFLLILSGILGFWGIFVGTLLIIGHIVSIRSFGIPYTTPLAPLLTQDLDDVLIRAPQWKMTNRPSFLNGKNHRRKGGKNQKPTPPKSN